jgi:hypothetical protein
MMVVTKFGFAFLAIVFVCISLQDEPRVSITIPEAKLCKGCGHNSWDNTSVTFRLLNESNKSLTVFGSEVEGRLDPTRYRLRLDTATGEWRYPANDGKSPTWESVSAARRTQLSLKPGESLTFSAVMSHDLDAGKPFKLAIWISTEGSKIPVLVESSELVFK